MMIVEFLGNNGGHDVSEKLLVFRRDRKNVTVGVEKEGKFLVVIVDASLFGDYIWVQKVMRSVVS